MNGGSQKMEHWQSAFFPNNRPFPDTTNQQFSVPDNPDPHRLLLLKCTSTFPLQIQNKSSLCSCTAVLVQQLYSSVTIWLAIRAISSTHVTMWNVNGNPARKGYTRRVLQIFTSYFEYYTGSINLPTKFSLLLIGKRIEKKTLPSETHANQLCKPDFIRPASIVKETIFGSWVEDLIDSRKENFNDCSEILRAI